MLPGSSGSFEDIDVYDEARQIDLLTRRRFVHLSGLATGPVLLGGASAGPADFTLEIAPYTLEASPKHHIRTVAYNGQVQFWSWDWPYGCDRPLNR
jgi:hypothetical protein